MLLCAARSNVCSILYAEFWSRLTTSCHQIYHKGLPLSRDRVFRFGTTVSQRFGVHDAPRPYMRMPLGRPTAQFCCSPSFSGQKSVPPSSHQV